MELTPEEIATWKSSNFDFARVANLMFHSSIAQRLAELDDACLEKLADFGILLVDEARLAARDLSYETVYILTDDQRISEQDKRRWNFPRFTPDFIFSGLKEFVLIQRHMLRLPPDGRTWHQLTHTERLQVAIAYVSLLAPLEKYMAQIERRSRSDGRRGIAPRSQARRPRRRPH